MSTWTDFYDIYANQSAIQLQNLAQAAGLTVRGRKTEFVRALICHGLQMAAPFANLQWEDLSDQAIEASIGQLGLQYPAAGPATRAGHVAFLRRVGVLPHQCLNLPLPAQPVAPVPKLPPLAAQSSEEAPAAYFQRLTAYFQVCNVHDDQSKLRHLFSSAGSAVAAHVSQLVAAGIQQFDTIQQQTVTKLEPHFLHYFRQFTSMSKQSSESFSDFGRRLRAAYLGYLRLTEATIGDDQELTITAALITQLLTTISMEAQQFVQQRLLAEPGISWDQLTNQLEGFAATRRASRSLSTNRGASHRGGRSHSRSQPTCFRCKQVGHVASDCPQLHVSGNT